MAIPNMDRSTGLDVVAFAGVSRKVGTPVVTVLELDPAGNVLKAQGTSVPTDTDAGYAKGCIFVDTDAATGLVLWVNEGSATSADFNSLPPTSVGGVMTQGAPTAKTVSATLTAAELAAKIVTVNQGGAGSSALQLPLASAMDSYFTTVLAGNAIDVSVINISTVDAEDASVTTNTGWTLVGSMDFPAYSAAGSLNSSGVLRLRKTGTATWVAYRIS